MKLLSSYKQKQFNGVISKLVFVVLFSLFSGRCLSQKMISDSIHKKKMDSLVRISGKLWDSDINAAEAIAKKMLSYSKKHQFLRGIGQAHGTLAAISSYKGNEGYSLWHSQQALKVFEKLDNKVLTNKIRLNLGVSFYEVQEYEEALLHTQKAYDYFDKIKDTTYLTSAYISLGLIKSDLKANFEETDTILTKAIEMSRSIADTLYLSNALCLRADFLIDNDVSIPEAEKEAKESLNILHFYKPTDHLLLGYNYFVLAKLYMKKGKFSKALAYNDSAIQKYRLHEYMMGIKKSYENRVEIFTRTGNYKEANKTNIVLNSYKDTLQERREETQFNRLKIEYETDRITAEKNTLAAEAKLLRLQSKQNRNYLIGLLVVSFFILLSALFYIGRLKTKKKAAAISAELQQTALEKRNMESELKALKSQMNPHFIFNALNTIQDYIIDNKKTKASEYLGDFADLIRRYLMQSNTAHISLYDEVESLKIYLGLEALRFEDNFEYSISQSHMLEKDIIHIPNMLVQPYVENAIRHGLLHKEGKRKLLVTFSKGKDNTVLCVIEDNGVGRKRTLLLKAKKGLKHVSFAEKATSTRLALFNKKNDHKVGVKIIDLYENDVASGTKVLLTIPILN